MIVASSNATKPLYDAEFRLHKYSTNIADVRYYRPEAGHTGKYCLRDFLENAKNGKYWLCVTLNLRDDLGGKKFAIRPINEYMDAARQVANLFKQYGILGFINLWSEPVYRYKLSIPQANQYIDAVKNVIGDIPLGAGGEETCYGDFQNAMIYNPKVDIVTNHQLSSPAIKINTTKKVAILEMGTQNQDYRTVNTANYIYNLFKQYHDHKTWWVGLVYVDSNYDGDINYTARHWKGNYDSIETITPTYFAWANAIKDFGDDMNYNRIPQLQTLLDALNIGNPPYQWDLPWLSLFVVGDKNPTQNIIMADLDAMFEKLMKSRLFKVPEGIVVPDIKYQADGSWNAGWQAITKSNPKVEV
jgi:hypothetical protein